MDSKSWDLGRFVARWLLEEAVECLNAVEAGDEPKFLDALWDSFGIILAAFTLVSLSALESSLAEYHSAQESRGRELQYWHIMADWLVDMLVLCGEERIKAWRSKVTGMLRDKADKRRWTSASGCGYCDADVLVVWLDGKGGRASRCPECGGL